MVTASRRVSPTVKFIDDYCQNYQHLFSDVRIRLIIQPYIFYCLISPWLTVFPIPGLRRKFYDLIYCIDDFPAIYTPFSATSSITA